jgi:hypothetical protein
VVKMATHGFDRLVHIVWTAASSGAARLVHVLRAAASSAGAGAFGLLICLAGPASLAQAAASPAAGTLTCFAVDVSGSNLYSSNGEPASDPGPVFVRQQVVELYAQILADYSQTVGQRLGVVTFGTAIGTDIGPLTMSGPATESELAAAMPGALQPAPAEAAWTDWVAGVNGCERMFERSGATHGMVAVLTDGFPQGPAGGPARQLAAISPIARKLGSEGISIQPVLYGAGADQPGSARHAMTQLAAMGHGQLVLAATPLDMLRSALSLASHATGLQLGGSEISVDGTSSVGMQLSPQIATAVLVVLRSSDKVQVSVAAPGGKTLSTAAVGSGNLGLVIPLTQPAAGKYLVSADGQGSVFAAELVLYNTVPVPSPSPSVHPDRIRHAAGSSLIWLVIVGLVVLAVAAVVSWRITARRRRPKGTLVLWWGPDQRILDPAEVDGRVDIAELLRTGADPAGWSVEWTRRSPIVTGPDGTTVHLLADETKTVETDPPATFTWLPDGIDTVYDEPPGRPASTVP